MPVTRPLLSCSPFLSFQSALRASGQSCAQCPWFLDNLHFVQPEKVMFTRRTQSTFVRCSCLFIQRLALRLSWTEKQSRSGRISMHPAGLLGRWVFYILAVPASPYFHVGNTNISSVLVVQTHTNRLSHFSFFLPANFLHFLSFSFC